MGGQPDGRPHPFLTSEQQRNYLRTDGFNVDLGGSFYRPGLEGFGGAVWLFRWSDIETSEGVYNFANLDASIEYARTRSKKLMPRLTLKSFLDPEDPPTAGETVAPGYVLNDHATYGGSAGSGGTLRGYHYTDGTPVWQGWTVNICNAAVLAKLQAMLTALLDHIKTNAVFNGFVFDEFILGLYHDVWPSGVDQAAEVAAIEALVNTAVASVGASRVYVGMNYLDGDSPPNYPGVKALSQWVLDQGARLMEPDVFLATAVPTYDLFQTSGTGLSNVDVYDAAHAQEYLDRAHSLNSALISWYYKGAADPDWQAVAAAIAAY